MLLRPNCRVWHVVCSPSNQLVHAHRCYRCCSMMSGSSSCCCNQCAEAPRSQGRILPCQCLIGGEHAVINLPVDRKARCNLGIAAPKHLKLPAVRTTSSIKHHQAALGSIKQHNATYHASSRLSKKFMLHPYFCNARYANTSVVSLVAAAALNQHQAVAWLSLQRCHLQLSPICECNVLQVITLLARKSPQPVLTCEAL